MARPVSQPCNIEPLGKRHDRRAFSCGNEPLDRYLKQQASQDARRHVAAPLVAVREEGDKTILGYYTLSAFAIDLGTLPDRTASKLPLYPLGPVTLGRLAVDHRYRGRGLGGFLLWTPCAGLMGSPGRSLQPHWSYAQLTTTHSVSIGISISCRFPSGVTSCFSRWRLSPCCSRGLRIPLGKAFDEPLSPLPLLGEQRR